MRYNLRVAVAGERGEVKVIDEENKVLVVKSIF